MNVRQEIVATTAIGAQLKTALAKEKNVGAPSAEVLRLPNHQAEGVKEIVVLPRTTRVSGNLNAKLFQKAATPRAVQAITFALAGLAAVIIVVMTVLNGTRVRLQFVLTIIPAPASS